MGSARKITDRHDLAAIHGEGAGFIFHPFGRKLHHARCATVPGMALNPKERRWFAPDVAAARAYQSDRLDRYPTAQPFERVACCASLVPEAAVVGTRDDARRSPQPGEVTPSSAGLDSASGRLWVTRQDSASVELWTTRRTPFSTDQSSEQKAMVREITPRVASLRCGNRQRLHGVFVSDETSSRQPDAENIAYYNFGSAPFAGAGSAMAFERSYAAAPVPPQALEAAARYYHRWSVVPEDAPFVYWIPAGVVAGWKDVPLDPSGDLGLNAWRALREHADLVGVHAAMGATEPFGIDVTLTAPPGRVPDVVTAMKGLVDGPVAALQRADSVGPEVVSRLLARRWSRPMDERTLLRLATADEPNTLLPRPPFNRNGLDPCDEHCVAGIVRVLSVDAPARVTGCVFRVESRPRGHLCGDDATP